MTGKSEKNKEKKQVRFQSLGVRMMWNLSVPVVCVFIVAAVMILAIMKSSMNELSETELTVKSQAASYQISEFFSVYFSQAEQIAANSTYEELILLTENGTRMEELPAFEKVKENLVRAQKIDEENILSTWIAGFGISELVMSDGFLSEEGLDVTTRPWYATKEANATILTSPYEDVSTGKQVITIATPIRNAGTGEIIGAAGLDITLDQVKHIMSGYTLGESGKFLLTDADSNIVYYEDDSMIGKNVSEIGLSDNMAKAITNNKSVFQEYTMNGSKNYGYANNIDKINWTVTSILPQREYYSVILQLAVFVIGLFLVGMAVVVVMIRAITGSVVKPLKKLTKSAEQIADGNLDVTVEVESKDEIGTLGGAISDTVRRLKEYIRYINEISEILLKIADGNLKFELKEEYAGEFAVLKDGLLQIQKKLTGTLTNMNQVAGQVEEGARQIAQVASSLSDSSGEQADSADKLNHIVTAVNEMAEETQNNAKDAKESTKEAGEYLVYGNTKMGELTESIKKISDSSQKISGIMAIIDDISTQTNMLSLNASIEAARAGEAGKGFAVVANEVGTLAKQTADSAKETRELITNVLEEIKQGTQVAAEASETMLEVIEKSNESAGSMEEITSAVIKETESIGILQKETEQITSSVENNMAISEESVASSEELAALATVLRRLVEEFQI